ncbi:hypothetical protein Tco_1152166, partial [Tanacetum coccineum]
MSYDHIRPIFKKQYNKVQTLFKKDSKVSNLEKKRVAEEASLQESFKKLRTDQDSGSKPFQEQSTEDLKELSEEDVKKMLEIVLVEYFRVEALQKFTLKAQENIGRLSRLVTLQMHIKVLKICLRHLIEKTLILYGYQLRRGLHQQHQQNTWKKYYGLN